MKRARGASLVEAALVLPLVVLILLGGFEVGRVVNLDETLTNAAREGARWSAMPAAGTANLPAATAVQARVVAFAAGANLTLDPSAVTVNQAVSLSEGGLATSFSQVDVTYTYSVSTPLVAALLPTLTLRGHALMRNETN